jgi:tetratricopeptide (TPR) repeat protein
MRHVVALAALVLAAAAPNDPAQPLLDALKQAPTPLQASALEAKIEAAWQATATPAVQLLVERAMGVLQHNGAKAAFDDLDAAVDLQPSLADLWRLRAQARFATGDEAGAAADLAQALLREPRCFPALADLSRIAESRKDFRDALDAWNKFMQVDPHAAGAEQRRDRLQRAVSGEPL